MKKGMVLIAVGLLAACSSEPVYYEEDEIIEYVDTIWGDGYTLTETNETVDTSDEKNPVYHYTFTDDKDMSFTVTTYTYHTSIDASETSLYTKGIKNDFNSQVVAYYQDDIEQLLDSGDFNYSIDGAWISYNIESLDQLDDVSETIVKIDNMMALELNLDEYSVNLPEYKVYLKPNLIEDSLWESNYDYLVVSMKASISDASRYDSSLDDDIYVEAIESIKETIWYDEGYYELSEEDMLNYPFKWIRLVDGDGNRIETLYYGKSSESYYFDLDVDLDFLQPLIEAAGGTYTSDDSSTSWILDGDSYTGEYIEQAEGEYNTYEISKNGELLMTLYGVVPNNFYSSEVRFSAEQMETLLDKTIVIEQMSMSATLQ